MTLPRAWPFMSPLAERAQPSDQQDHQEPALCECHGDGVELEEIADNKCLTCGKPLIVWVAGELPEGASND